MTTMMLAGWVLRRYLHPVLRPAGQGDAHRDPDAGAVSEQLGALETAGRGEEEGEGEAGAGKEGARETRE